MNFIILITQLAGGFMYFSVMGIKEYDVFVIGTGTAGKGVAIDCVKDGMICTTNRQSF